MSRSPGWHHTEETKKKISEGHKGKVVSEETRQKLSALNKGKKQAPEVTEKIRAANTGKKRSMEFRKRLSERSKGHKKSEETLRKMSEAQKGKKQSKETIEKRVAHLPKGETHHAWKGGDITKKCEGCGKEFTVEHYRKNEARCCSLSCKGKWQSENAVGEKGAHWQGGGVTKKCEECGKEFNVERTRMETARFCSQHCKGIWLAKNGLISKLPIMTGANHPQWKGGDITKKCEECGKEFLVRKAREKIGRFCSFSCHGKWMSKNIFGEKHPRWTGGPKEYCEKWTADFRKRIRAFFNDECVECGTLQKKPLLHCHHVYYDKKSCCSIIEDGRYFSNLGIKGNPYSFEIIGDPNKFIPLCERCHSISTGKKNREYWARHFEEIINNYYLGKSYFTKEEFEKLR